MIYYPKIFGTCTGANKAINIALKLKDEFKDKNIFIYKEILHNEYVINNLEKQGIKTIDNLEKLNKDDILIIRAHGEGKSTYDYLNQKGITYYDATCINVERIHKLVADKYESGFKIIIVGKKNHPEVIGTNGWCNNTAIIIENENDYKELNINDYYYVVSQTTISEDKTNNLLDYLAFNKFHYSVDNTICNHQRLIQNSSVELAKNMNYMIVIGGKNSSNTKELYNECNKVCKSFFFTNINEFYDFIHTFKFKESDKIGFTGGASTSKEQIFEMSNLLEFIIYYKNTKKKIEREMIKFNKTISSSNKTINDSINKFKSINSDGKCIRGTLIDLGYKLYKNDDYSIPLSSAYETFETSILVHDDIIDNSPLRRGKQTIHETYKNDFKDYILDNTPTSLALCLGDLGFFYINNYIIKNYKKDKNISRLLEYYNNIVINTIKGEILDVYLPFVEKNDKNHILNEDDIFEIYRRKTSIYTIVGPFILGMILGNAKKKDIEFFEKSLEPLGIAFQIKDDILGIFSDNNTLGKPISSDIEEFKQTILYSYIKLNKSEYLNELLKYYGNKTNEDSILKVREIITNSGSLQNANNIMNSLFQESKNSIVNSNINLRVKNILLGFIKYLELRKK